MPTELNGCPRTYYAFSIRKNIPSEEADGLQELPYYGTTEFPFAILSSVAVGEPSDFTAFTWRGAYPVVDPPVAVGEPADFTTFG